MLPSTESESPEQAAQRQANFILLRSLESKLPAELFEQVLTQASPFFDLPKRIDWTGQQQALTFHEIKVNCAYVDQNYLPQLLESSLTSNNKHKSSKFNINENSAKNDAHSSNSHLVRPKNLMFRHRQLGQESCGSDTVRLLELDEISRFERMKTVFGHCLIEEGYNAPIYNVIYDQTDSFIISGADDGIIKIWDKNSLNLQAALHSHEDVITDLDISICNQFLATASKDGKIIIWDWKKCVKLDEIIDHKATVNNIKFFQIKVKGGNESPDKIQILVSCSEDGTIKLYDEIAYLKQLVAPAQTLAGRRSQRQKQEHVQKKDRYSVTLTPEDFRPGSRNKKIYSVHVSKDGLVVAGSDKGDVYLWQIDVAAFKRHQETKASSIVFAGKKHQKQVLFCEFSPDCKNLITGSDDGTAKIWKIDKDQIKNSFNEENLIIVLEQKRITSKEEQATYFTNSDGALVNLGQHKEKKSTWECDCIVWSVYGRYAIAALSGKFEEDKNQNHSVIKVWDSLTNETVQNLAKGNNIQLTNSTFVLKPHPKLEEIIITGSEGGTICLWNIKTRVLLKKFFEYGVYSFEKYTMSDPCDGRFSHDGSSFIISSEMGTLSLFSCNGSNFMYEATRVEQFFMMDGNKHKTNIYYDEEAKEEPKVCGYGLIPYEIQPPSSLIGKFAQSREYSNQEYERNYLFRLELSRQEEEFIQNQLEDGIQNAMFNNPNINQGEYFEEDKEGDEQIQIRRGNNRQVIDSQNSLNLSDSPIQRVPNNMASQEDANMLQQIQRTQRRNQSADRRRGEPARQISINPNLDHSSDENYQSSAHSAIEEEDEEMPSEGDETYENENIVTDGRRRLTRNVQVVQDSVQRPRGQNTRRNNRVQSEESEEEKEVQRRSKRKKAVIDSEEDSVNSSDLNEDDVYKMSDINEGPQTRRRLGRAANETNRRAPRLPSSDDVSVDSDLINEDDSEFGNRRSMRRTRQRAAASRSNGRSQPKREERSRGRNLRSRNNQVNYEGMDESSDATFDHAQRNLEEEKVPQSKAIDTETSINTNSKRKRAVIEESSEEEIDESQLQGNEDYQLVDLDQNPIQLEEDMIAQQRSCQLCKRVDGLLIGPFIKAKSTAINKPQFYFHQNCIEANNVSFFNKQKNKWLNIGKAMQVNQKNPTMCDRCGNVGATIKCTNCRKTYHGYFCSTLYMIYIQPQTYQCFQCRNKENFKNLESTPQLSLEKPELKQMQRSIPRDYLLIEMQTTVSFIPQLDDEVYYFFQGHEKFIHDYNCFFYCGDSQELTFTYPWELHHILKKPTLCRIVSINHRLPSSKALYLLKKFGKTMESEQIPQIISRLELQIVDDPDSKFEVDYFPSVLPEYLVDKTVYEHSFFQYELLLQENQLVGQVFKKKGKDGANYRVIAVKEHEGTVHQNTNWLTLECKLEEQYRLRHGVRRFGRGDAQEENSSDFMSFWNLELSKDVMVEMSQGVEERSIDPKIRELAINIIADTLEKKRDIAIPFMQRVPESVAKDYRQVIPAEMFFNLIQIRLVNQYYRSLNQLYADLDQICYNARVYNSEDHPLTLDAKKLIEMIRRQIRGQIGNNLGGISFEEEPRKRPIVEESTKIVINTMNRPVGKNFGNLKSQQPGKMSAVGRPPSDQSLDEFRREFQEVEDARKKSRPREYQEEIKSAFFYEDNRSTLIKIPLLIPAAGQTQPNGRRQTRQNARINENSHDSFSVGDQSNGRGPISQGEDALLARTTRSGRNQKMLRQNLNEDSDDSSERYLDDDLPPNGFAPSRKRVRQQ